jgi:hypothetical protein
MSKIAAAKRTNGGADIDLKASGVVCLERVALRKNWGKRPTYWVDIIQDSFGKFQVFRSWQWMDGSTPVEGTVGHGPPTMSAHRVVSDFQAAVYKQVIEKSYIIEERLAAQNSPMTTNAWNAFLANLNSVAPTPPTPQVSFVDPALGEPWPDAPKTPKVKKKAPLPKRKPEKDWW